jgi:hypothetical protein
MLKSNHRLLLQHQQPALPRNRIKADFITMLATAHRIAHTLIKPEHLYVRHSWIDDSKTKQTATHE